jgi:pimeloyl-ACP methyl ester carboxylesterase
MATPHFRFVRHGTVFLLLASVLMTRTSPTGAAADAGAAGAIPPVIECSSLTGVDFSTVPDAPSVVTSAAEVTDAVAGAPHSFCDVKGYISPQTQFEIKLPTTDWHGQYLQEGCRGGGLCGRAEATDEPDDGRTCVPITNGQIALASDDGGHTGLNAFDGVWGKDDPQLRAVFGLTSQHSLAQLAKAVITHYYGRGPARTYFDGCSTGGQEGLMLAQRYPTDFDGIIAGAPASNLAPLAGIYETWLVRSNTDAAGRQILGADKLPALHAAVLSACAAANGVIMDPRTCAFDPASIQCPSGTDTPNCLTAAQVETVRKLYRGPTDPAGRNLFNGGEPYGSELEWSNSLIGGPSEQIALNFLKYLAYRDNPPSTYTLADFQFTDAAFAKLNELGQAIYNANDPDLRAFAAHGGKLIVYHGWADEVISPWSTLDYYAAVEQAVGGFGASQSFSRLYLVPGAYHCLGGVDAPDLLTALIDWVEHGTAPGAIAVSLSASGQTAGVSLTVQPEDALAPVQSPPGSLNGHYDYIGHYPG